jgi:hypothetical protein
MNGTAAEQRKNNNMETRNERRQTLRRRCHLPVALDTIASSAMRPGLVRDISETGLGVAVGRRYEPGTMIGLRIGEEDSQLTVLARVAQVIPMPNGEWLLGCRFLSEVDPDEIQSLLDQSDRPRLQVQSSSQDTWVAEKTAQRLDLKAVRERLRLLACGAVRN